MASEAMELDLVQASDADSQQLELVLKQLGDVVRNARRDKQVHGERDLLHQQERRAWEAEREHLKQTIETLKHAHSDSLNLNAHFATAPAAKASAASTHAAALSAPAMQVISASPSGNSSLSLERQVQRLKKENAILKRKYDTVLDDRNRLEAKFTRSKQRWRDFKHTIRVVTSANRAFKEEFRAAAKTVKQSRHADSADEDVSRADDMLEPSKLAEEEEVEDDEDTVGGAKLNLDDSKLLRNRVDDAVDDASSSTRQQERPSSPSKGPASPVPSLRGTPSKPDIREGRVPLSPIRIMTRSLSRSSGLLGRSSGLLGSEGSPLKRDTQVSASKPAIMSTPPPPPIYSRMTLRSASKNVQMSPSSTSKSHLPLAQASPTKLAGDISVNHSPSVDEAAMEREYDDDDDDGVSSDRGKPGTSDGHADNEEEEIDQIDDEMAVGEADPDWEDVHDEEQEVAHGEHPVDSHYDSAGVGDRVFEHAVPLADNAEESAFTLPNSGKAENDGQDEDEGSTVMYHDDEEVMEAPEDDHKAADTVMQEIRADASIYLNSAPPQHETSPAYSPSSPKLDVLHSEDTQQIVRPTQPAREGFDFRYPRPLLVPSGASPFIFPLAREIAVQPGSSQEIVEESFKPFQHVEKSEKAAQALPEAGKPGPAAAIQGVTTIGPKSEHARDIAPCTSGDLPASNEATEEDEDQTDKIFTSDDDRNKFKRLSELPRKIQRLEASQSVLARAAQGDFSGLAMESGAHQDAFESRLQRRTSHIDRSRALDLISGWKRLRADRPPSPSASMDGRAQRELSQPTKSVLRPKINWPQESAAPVQTPKVFSASSSATQSAGVNEIGATGNVSTAAVGTPTAIPATRTLDTRLASESDDSEEAMTQLALALPADVVHADESTSKSDDAAALHSSQDSSQLRKSVRFAPAPLVMVGPGTYRTTEYPQPRADIYAPSKFGLESEFKDISDPSDAQSAIRTTQASSSDPPASGEAQSLPVETPKAPATMPTEASKPVESKSRKTTSSRKKEKKSSQTASTSKGARSPVKDRRSSKKSSAADLIGLPEGMASSQQHLPRMGGRTFGKISQPIRVTGTIVTKAEPVPGKYAAANYRQADFADVFEKENEGNRPGPSTTEPASASHLVRDNASPQDEVMEIAPGLPPAAHQIKPILNGPPLHNAHQAQQMRSASPADVAASALKRKRARGKGSLPDDVQSDLDAMENFIKRKTGAAADKPTHGDSPSSAPRAKQQQSLPPAANLSTNQALNTPNDRVLKSALKRPQPATEYMSPSAMAWATSSEDRPADDGAVSPAMYFHPPAAKRQRMSDDENQAWNTFETGAAAKVLSGAEDRSVPRNYDSADRKDEEFPGQAFMREIHDKRRIEMIDDPLKYKGKGAYARQVVPTGMYSYEQPKQPVAYKEVVRDASVRKQMHGVDCPCCSGYYEYAVRHLPLEQRAEAAVRLQQEVSRHREAAPLPDTPPSYWQLGFPDTQEVEKINEQARAMREAKAKAKAVERTCPHAL